MKKLNVGASSARPHFEEITKKSPLPPRGTVSGADWGFSNKGITLIALIITIIVMLILVIVSIQIALNTGLFDAAGKATQKWETAQDEEKELAGGQITIGNKTYGSVDEYIKVNDGNVARIESTYYTSLQSAVDTVPADGTETTVYLLTNVSENILISENQNVIINLGGCTVTNVEGVAVAGNWEQAVFEVYGNLKLINGKIVAEYGRGIEFYGAGTVDINVEEIISSEYQAVYNGSTGTINITGGTMTGVNKGVVYNSSGIINITGGTFTSQYVGLSENREYSVICNYGSQGVITISGGKIIAHNSDAIYNEYGKVVIGGGEIIGQSGNDRSVVIYNGNDGEFTINGGVITANRAGLIGLNGGVLNVSGNARLLSYSSTSCSATDIYVSNGSFIMTGGEITSYSANWVLWMDSLDGRRGVFIRRFY